VPVGALSWSAVNTLSNWFWTKVDVVEQGALVNPTVSTLSGARPG
jgi:hypothetical protein